ncbi:Ca-activated chloride channel family protein [Planococcus glaciei]|uniref:vWA domain-containing protein n=1 Tax=Planococcus glaciei TaxID=459472 RepID=UPI000881C9F5|nr:VWA domain-containing protein [Planococcus glaciei]SDG63843.1 Ca-activated chloride channel family protein [Planococcus glaciei]
MRLTKCLLLPLIALSMAACQSESQPEKPEAEAAEQKEPKEQKAADEKAEKDIESVLASQEMLKVPENDRDLINQPPGKIGGMDISLGDTPQIKEAFFEAFGDVPALPEDATEKELELYFNYIYSLVAYDFQDPQDVLDQMEFALSGTPEADPRFAFKENYNVEIILDASGSMANYVGDQTRMELAKKAIRDFVGQIPEEAKVSLRIYGHEGTGSEADKAASCKAIDEVYKRGAYDQASFDKAMDAFKPAGWTPVAGALESAKESFKGLDAKSNTNLVYLVSDGIETCDGDPVAVAKTFADSNISPIINVIGFNVDGETQQQLKEVAAAANGIFANVSNGAELAEEFKQSKEVLARWESWKVNSETDVLAASNASSLAISKFENQWYADTDGQYLGLVRVFGFLREKGYLTFDQVDDLTVKAGEIEQLSKESREAIINDLNQVKDQGLDKMRIQIDEKYKKNTTGQ